MKQSVTEIHLQGTYQQCEARLRKWFVEFSLTKSRGNKTQAAKLMGINRATLLKYVRDYKVNVRECERIRNEK